MTELMQAHRQGMSRAPDERFASLLVMSARKPYCCSAQGACSRELPHPKFRRSLAEPWADTGTSTGRLMLAVLGGPADGEPDLIRPRTPEGLSRAKAQGDQIGRPRRGDTDNAGGV